MGGFGPPPYVRLTAVSLPGGGAARHGASMPSPTPPRKPDPQPAPAARVPRGIRNHNPGNVLRTKSVTWQGQAEDQSGDPEFVVFTAPEWGLRAIARILLTPCENRADRRYEVVATADREVLPRTEPASYTPFVVARAVSGYVAGQTRVLRLTLQASCRDVLSCTDTQSCNAGICVAAAIDQNLLPRLGDGARDASGIDAAPIDASAPIDAPEPIDASISDAYSPSDAYSLSDAHETPDASETPDAYAPPTCDDLYNLVPGYELCSQEEFACQFSTFGTCRDACGDTRFLSCLDDSMTRCVPSTPGTCLPTTPGAICTCGRF